MVKGECCELASSRNQSLDVGLWESVSPCITGREVCVIVLITSQSLAGMDTCSLSLNTVHSRDYTP